MAKRNGISILQRASAEKAAIYVRVSTHWQVDKDSLQVQQRELIGYCSLVLGIKDYHVFEDPGYSAKNTDRPAYQAMISRIRAGEFSHLLVWKIDRISRNLLDFAELYAELKRLGVVFVSKNEQFDTSSAIGEAMLKIILVFAELERNMTSERVSAVMLSRASEGQWNGGRVPYGYSYDKASRTFSLDKSESEVVRRIYDIYEERQSSTYIAKLFNEEGLLTRNGSKWSGVATHKILTNPFYYGAYRYNIRKGSEGELRDEAEWVTVEDHHPPLVSKERFEQIQYRLKKNKRGGNQRGKTVERKHTHIFAGLLKCGICGAGMVATPGKRRADGWAPSNYSCFNHRKGACDNRYTSDLNVAPFVLSYISNLLLVAGSVGQKTTTDKLERRLLHGEVFESVLSIEKAGLSETLKLMKAGKTGAEYTLEKQETASGEFDAEATELEDRRRKQELALSRLKALYMYSESGIPEKEFTIERKRIVDELNSIDERLAQINQKKQEAFLDEKEFERKGSYLVMTSKLMGGFSDNPMKYIRSTEPSVTKSFLNTVLESVSVVNGDVTEIAFKNGITHRFLYK